ncbi:ArsR/SmtB family transcription factor [Phreatobacter stygius]|uniref:Winged helix-turn-helix transcriptional regulator n=1 Tax=Phreatobacter stygius TaxID=1940610 RepID=A0A4D7AWK5_9HYPH|nr:metalloregulator ArsR/SmtB family transcription factor [Phreatobacter stygius]QCI65499.1 winged helix-turn-helix transcriptional regulator [Phreatobacter stygius]
MSAFAALSDPTRRAIVAMLSQGERAVADIVERFDISAPAISQHLKVLRETRLVSMRVDGQRRIYRLDPTGLDEIDAWLGEVRAFWSGKLDALERELRKPQADQGTPKKPRSK